MITGKTLIDWGFTPGKWFGEALKAANAYAEADPECSVEDLKAVVAPFEPAAVQVQEYRTNSIPFGQFIDAETEAERTNVDAVIRAMDSLMRTPTIKAGAVMPDACPAGVIPVGGVVAAEDAIHPGFHSADICCSMALSVFKRDVEVGEFLDAAMKITHFGPGKRTASEARRSSDLKELLATFEENRFLSRLEDAATHHFMTQGDGNHFLFVGRMKSSGRLAMVTHHGSRGLGAHLYKRGMAVAKKHTRIHSPKTPGEASWIRADSDDGRAYWEALQTIRAWTKLNHFGIHDAVAKKLCNRVEDRMWNEHNFVFQKSDGLFYHGKGATPNWSGFSPHGAGRNMSRTQFLRENRPKLPEGIDVRFYCGKPDLSELPQAYKSAEAVRSQIEKYGLGRVVDEIEPLGTIMAGDWEADAPWRKKRK